MINGRPEDPVERRPFEHAFTPAKIVRSCAKLGLSPVNLKLALSHKRVRDDSGDGSRGVAELAIRDRHKSTLENLAEAGVAVSVLTVDPTISPAPAPAATLVAGPSKAEAEWKALRAAGSIPGAIFHSVGAKAFNGPLITSAALERVKEKAAVEGAKNEQASGEFIALQSRVQDLLDWMVNEKADYGDFSQSERREIISYVFKARGQSGISKHTTNADASIDFLDSLDPGDLPHLLLDPPCLHGNGRVAKGMGAAPALLQLTMVNAQPLEPTPPKTLLSDFGDLEGLETDGLSPMVMQPCVQAAVAPGAGEEAEQLVGKFILYKWPPRLGSWAVGKVMSVNNDPNVKVGQKVCNFRVYYASDKATADHCLEAGSYARNSKSPADSWVLLGQD